MNKLTFETFDLNSTKHFTLVTQALQALNILQDSEPSLTKHQHLLLDIISARLEECFKN